jgi:hypothetical protein
MIDLFSAIQDQLAQEVPELLFIDLDTQQVERQDNSYELQFPCVLINFNAQWSGADVQRGEVSIDFRVYFQITADTHHESPNKSDAFTELELMNKIHSKLQGFKGDSFTKLIRLSTDREPRGDMYTCFIANYKTTYTDISAKKQYNYIQVSPQINVEFVDKIEE